MIESLTVESFDDRIGERFRVPVAEHELLILELIKVESTSGEVPEGRRRPFSLTFRGPTTPVLGQATVPIEHDDLRGLALFLVPIGPDDQGMRYQASFN